MAWFGFFLSGRFLMCTHILGIDIAKRTFDVALLNGESSCSSGHFDNTLDGFQSLRRWLSHRKVDSVHACMEATGRYGHSLAAFLWAESYDVSMVNPTRIHAYGQSKLLRTKTDKTDAILIADFCATQSPPLWEPPSDFQTELQSLTRHLDALKSNRKREINRLKSGIPSGAVQRSIQDHIDFLDEQIKQVDQEIQQLAKENEEYRKQIQLLVSIPGISTTTATRFLAEVPDVNAFPQARQLASYAGLCPKHHRSGTSVRKKSRLAKTGNTHLRTTFYMPALSVMRGNNSLLQPLVNRLREEGRQPMVIIGAIMRKLLHIAYGVLKTGKPFDPNYLSGSLSA
jgi:transposase